MTTSLNATHRNIARRRARYARAGIGGGDGNETLRMPAGTNIADPLSFAERSKSITIIANVVHDGVPDGILFHLGVGTKGIAIGFDEAAGTAQFLFRSAVLGASVNSHILDGTTPIVLSEGLHTYVFSIKAGTAGYATHVYVDGVLWSQDITNNTTTWSTAVNDWYAVKTPAAAITSYTHPTTPLTNALLIGELEVHIRSSPGVVGI